ncbi:MAG: serine/threonine protein kinase [Proteobacteria bacterium]|nr:serine/threonine protein kinase [Pseudomonadota bacterium]
MLESGQVLDRYTIVRPLGRGGLATVYLVRHNRLGSLQALKVLAVPSTRVRGRLLREGRVQAQLRHPNVASVIDVLEVDGNPSLLMEYVNGPSLKLLLAKAELNIDQIDDLARGILTGVAAAHSRGLVHRDIKPGNVLLSIEPQRLVAKITDFGLAKVLNEKQSGMQTRTGIAMGTPAYMAPEQIRDSSRINACADVFSLGALLFRLATGETAFVGKDTFEVFVAIAEGRYEDPAKLKPELPHRMVDCIKMALQLEPAARPQTAGELLTLWEDSTPAPTEPWGIEFLQAPREEADSREPLRLDMTENTSSATLSIPSEIFPTAQPPKETATVMQPKAPWLRSLALAAASVSLLSVAIFSAAWWHLDRTRLKVISSPELYLSHGELVAREGQVGSKEYYRVESRGGRLLQAKRLNTSGFPAPLGSSDGPAIFRQSFSTEGRAERISFFNSHDSPIHHIELKEQNGYIELYHRSTTGLEEGAKVVWLPELAVDVPVERLDFDYAGNITRVQWFELWGNAMFSADQMAGIRLTRDVAGHETTRTFLDFQGEPALNRHGVATLAKVWHEDLIVEERQLGFGGVLVDGKGGWSIRRFDHDDKGRLVKTSYFNADGGAVVPDTEEGGCAVIEVEYQPRVQVSTCLNQEGHPTVNLQGICRYEIGLGKRGYEATHQYYGALNNPISLDGISSWQIQHNDYGNAIEVGPFYDVAGKIVPSPQGGYLVRQLWDDEGKLVEKSYLDQDRKLVNGPEGAAIERRSFHLGGNQRTFAGYDSQSRPTTMVDGYASLKTEADHFGRIVTTSYLNAEGKPTANIHGIASETVTWEASGYQQDQRFFDVDGHQVSSSESGFHRTVWTRDAMGFVLEESFFDANDKPVLYQSYATRKIKRDKWGNAIDIRFFGLKGEPVLAGSIEAARWLQTFDSRGRVVRRALRDQKGQTLWGCTRIDYVWDVGGQLKDRRCVDASGAPTDFEGSVRQPWQPPTPEPEPEPTTGPAEIRVAPDQQQFTSMEVRCKSGFRARGNFNTFRAVVHNVPLNEDCTVFFKGGPPARAAIQGGQTKRCVFKGATSDCRLLE